MIETEIETETDLLEVKGDHLTARCPGWERICNKNYKYLFQKLFFLKYRLRFIIIDGQAENSP